jgi:hypothetical protein
MLGILQFLKQIRGYCWMLILFLFIFLCQVKLLC